MPDLTTEISFGLMLMTGFLGGAGHCVGTCGGYVVACSVGTSGETGHLARVVRQGVYHLGRIWCYGLMGAAAGWLGAEVLDGHHVQAGRTAVWFVAGVVMIGIGVRRLGWIRTRSLGTGTPGWYANLMSVVGGGKTVPHYALFGFLNGLVPCGLSYSVLPASAASGSPIIGAGLMLAFGIGTIPALGALAATSSMMASETRGRMLKIAASPPERLLSMAEGLERAKNHPIGRSLVEAAAEKGVLGRVPDSVRTYPGLGLSGTMVNGRSVFLGSERLMAREGLQMTDGCRAECVERYGKGESLIYLG